MTVNERIYFCGLQLRWDTAVFARNKEEMAAVLREVSISIEGSEKIVATILENPKKYGF